MRALSSLLGLSVLAFAGLVSTHVDAAPDPVSAVSAERVRAHKFRPANFATMKSDDDPEAYRVAGQIGPVKKAAALNVSKFSSELSAAFKDRVRGYAMQLRKNGNVVATQQSDFARTPAQGNKNFTIDSRMHIASLSKLITAIATVKALHDRGLSFDTKIGPYLPAYWPLGNNVANITFRRLLTHTSGFDVPPNGDCGCAGDYQTMKKVAAAAVPATAPTERHYENVNFSILRVILPILTGAVSRNIATTSDEAWDIQSTQIFLEYVHAKVFGPAGVSNVSAIPNANGALAYANSADTTGWDSADLSTQLGGAGFRVSVKEILDVMDAFRRKGTIVPTSKAQEAIDAGLGLDWERDTAAGKAYGKNGRWTDGSGHTEQTVGFFLPDGMEVALFTNSVLPNSSDLTAAVRDAFLRSIEEPGGAHVQVQTQAPTVRATK